MSLSIKKSVVSHRSPLQTPVSYIHVAAVKQICKLLQLGQCGCPHNTENKIRTFVNLQSEIESIRRKEHVYVSVLNERKM